MLGGEESPEDGFGGKTIGGTEAASETLTEAGGESAALRVTGESENRLSSEPFEARRP